MDTCQLEQNRWEKSFDLFLHQIGFDLVKYGDGWGLKDKTGTNLGDIEQDRFCDARRLLDRLDNYIYDYVVVDIGKRLDASKERWSDWAEMFNVAMQSLSAELKASLKEELEWLDMIVNHFNEIDLNHCAT